MTTACFSCSATEALPGLSYADDLVLCIELEEDLRVMVGWFAKVCKRRGLKVNADKGKAMVLNGV